MVKFEGMVKWCLVLLCFVIVDNVAGSHLSVDENVPRAGPGTAAPVSLARQVDIVSMRVVSSSLDQHHVKKFQLPTGTTVVRRGAPFKLEVTTAVPFEEPAALQFVGTESSRTPRKLYLETVSISKGEQPQQYIIVLQTPPNSVVGLFTVTLENTGQMTAYLKLAVLFNPYIEMDEVYLDDKALRAEYVENEDGWIWMGTGQQPIRSFWKYDQFSMATFLSLFRLLEDFKGDSADPREMARFLTFAVTQQNGNPNGLLVGNWNRTMDFRWGGKMPTAWRGSHELMRQYVNSGYQSVKYAQCWVFGGALNTLLRAIGIPTRQITNFGSAHETPVSVVQEDGSLDVQYTRVVESYYDEATGMFVGQKGSVWNFHSWNEAWLKRPDLSPPELQNSWQVVDATPQEPSGAEGFFKLGPASKKSVRAMKKDDSYDTAFVISEVYAEHRVYTMRCNTMYKPYQCSPHKMPYRGRLGTPVASLIVTKAPGNAYSAEGSRQLLLTGTYVDPNAPRPPADTFTAPAASPWSRRAPATSPRSSSPWTRRAPATNPRSTSPWTRRAPTRGSSTSGGVGLGGGGGSRWDRWSNGRNRRFRTADADGDVEEDVNPHDSLDDATTEPPVRGAIGGGGSSGGDGAWDLHLNLAVADVGSPSGEEDDAVDVTIALNFEAIFKGGDEESDVSVPGEVDFTLTAYHVPYTGSKRLLIGAVSSSVALLEQGGALMAGGEGRATDSERQGGAQTTRYVNTASFTRHLPLGSVLRGEAEASHGHRDDIPGCYIEVLVLSKLMPKKGAGSSEDEGEEGDKDTEAGNKPLCSCLHMTELSQGGHREVEHRPEESEHSRHRRLSELPRSEGLGSLEVRSSTEACFNSAD